MLAAIPSRARARHVANGVPDLPSRTDAVRSGDVRRGAAFVVGTLGRVSVEKGIPDFLEAAVAGRGSGVLFAVAGAGDIDAVDRAGPNVRYAGYFDRPDVYLAELDVYVQASRSEGLSLALLEAMRAGKPIVATDVGATRTAVTDGESALIVPPHRPARLLEAILAIKSDAALAKRLGAAARRRFESEFRIVHQHQRFLELYALGEPLR
jgi:glycosyltransferase involved in cell wall biosynthesis